MNGIFNRPVLRDPWWWLLAAGGLPTLVLVADTVSGALGGNPVQALHIRLGDWTLRFLCLTLLVTPLQSVFHWRGMADYRQLLGLYAWFYGSLHLWVYLALDFGWQWRLIALDLSESAYIWLGALTYLILLALGLTSAKWAKKRLGKHWKPLHRLIYVAAVSGVLHYFWQLKGNLAQPTAYALIVALLLGFRVAERWKQSYFNRMMIPSGRKPATEE